MNNSTIAVETISSLQFGLSKIYDDVLFVCGSFEIDESAGDLHK